MSQNEFEWDAFFSKASFNEIRTLSPEPSARRPPSTYSADRKFLYLSSQDNDVETSNEDQLRAAFFYVRNSYASASKFGHFNHTKAYIARVDFVEICRLLACLSDDPNEFSDPDGLLEVI